MIAILMQKRIGIGCPISLARDLAPAIKNIHGPVDAGISLESRFIRGIEISFFELVSIRIIFPANDGVAVRDDHRFAIDPYERDRDFIATFIILRFPSVVSILVKKRFAVHPVIALAYSSPTRVVA